MNYVFNNQKVSLPTHCEKIARHWCNLVCFDEFASGKVKSQKYKAVRAFARGLRDAGIGETEINRAYQDTQELARLYKNEAEARQMNYDEQS